MNIEIIHQISPECREIYGFTVVRQKPRLELKHTSTYVAYMDENGVWGDEWRGFYAQELQSEKRRLNREYTEETGGEYYDDGWDGNTEHSAKYGDTWETVFYELEKKYEPSRNKHHSGRWYLTGESGCNLSPPKMNENEIVIALGDVFDQMVKTLTYVPSKPVANHETSLSRLSYVVEKSILHKMDDVVSMHQSPD
jgi:hypothetical protein